MIYSILGSFCSFFNWEGANFWPQSRPRKIPASGYPLTLSMLSNYAFVVICLTFLKYSFRNTIRVSKCLDPDKDGRSVGLDLDPNGLQRLSTDNKSWRQQGKSKFGKSHQNKSFHREIKR